MRAFGTIAFHPVCLLASYKSEYHAALKVDMVRVNGQGRVLSWEAITWDVIVIGSSSISGCTGYAEFSATCSASIPLVGVGIPCFCLSLSCEDVIVLMVFL